MPDDLPAIYKDTVTETVYVLARRDRIGVTLRDLDSEPGDPDGVIVVSEWALWEAVETGRWQHCIQRNRRHIRCRRIKER
jgi:hypothetical protein